MTGSFFTPSEEESDSRGSYETPIRYKDYVGLSKSSSAVKRRCYSPLVLQTSCSSGEDDYTPLPKPKTDWRKSEVNGRRSQVLSKVLAPLNAPKSSVEDKENECAGTQSPGIIYYVYVDWKRHSIRSSLPIFDPQSSLSFGG